ncbi:MAG TPA: S8 family peptidase [Candidatus Nanoarchaeia archaeon]|nr:S8 family peptidase [Candidatus Nanoarchaeia archaeon]
MQNNNHNSGHGGNNSKLSLSERRNRALTDAIAAAKGGKSELEIIIKAEERRKEEVVSQLQRIGQVRHVYSLIPYLSLRCDADYADILRKASSGEVSDSVFEKAFRSIMPAISAIDISSKFSIPKARLARNTAPAAVRMPRLKLRTSLWNLEAIGAYEAQGYGTGEGVNVAVIDSGVDYSHSQLKGRFGTDKGYDFVKNDNEPMDLNGHGTHVAGTVASMDYGIAAGCRLYAVRVLDENGSGNEADAIAGIEWCIKNRIDVANMSFGGPVASQAFEEICRYAWQQGVLLAAAAGNSGYGANYPAAFGDSVIAVAAVDEALNHPGFSNIYETNDIAAPGVNVVSTYIGESYATLSGTSMASPHVTGSLALALSVAAQDGAAAEMENIMKSKAENLGEQEVFGSGLIRIDGMAEYLSGKAGYSNNKQHMPLVRDYFSLERKVDLAVSGFAKDALAELKRMFS